jgi:type III secretory pathway component EscV
LYKKIINYIINNFSISVAKQIVTNLIRKIKKIQTAERWSKKNDDFSKPKTSSKNSPLILQIKLNEYEKLPKRRISSKIKKMKKAKNGVRRA